MIQHPQQALPFLARDPDTFIQRRIPGGRLEELVEPTPQPFGFRSGRRRTIAQQAPVLVPVFRQKRREVLFVMRETRGQLFVMPPIVNPAQRNVLGQQCKLGRIVTHQRLHDGQQGRVVRVIGGNRQRILHPFPLLARQACGVGVQICRQFRLADGAILRYATQHLLVTGRHAHQPHEAFRAGIQPENMLRAAA
jgi:hypothetical protein